jgi:glycosyltransferase involved in cell wall biosynthesis
MSGPAGLIRLGLPLIGRGVWTGGLVYLKNTLRLIGSRLADHVEASVFLSPAEHEKFGAELAPLVNGRLIVDPAISLSGRGRSLAQALLTGQDQALGRLLKAADIDVAFEVASFYGARFAIPVVSWLPDLQHRHMPEMFTRANWWRRDLGFQAQIRSSRTLMVSSETARSDLERFYPSARGRIHVTRFAIDLDIAAYVERGREMRQFYHLPERFFFLPNQFWRHKNHTTLVAALAQLKAADQLVALPPIILSGLPKDLRNPTHFADLMAAATAAGVDSHFRYLGLIPYDHVLSLAATCDTLINPSHFEGWSTPIEEAKAFGAPLLLSDIAIHREQAPHAKFFDPKSVAAAAAALRNISQRPTIARPDVATLVAAQTVRLNDHAASLLKSLQAAVATTRAA